MRLLLHWGTFILYTLWLLIYLFAMPPAACGILVHWPGIKPLPSTVKVWSLNHCTAREVSFYTQFVLGFYHERVSYCLMLFLHLLKCYIIFIFLSVKKAYCIYWCVYVKAFLHPRNKSHLVTVYDPFNMLLNLRTVNWSSHYGNQYGGYSQNEK